MGACCCMQSWKCASAQHLRSHWRSGRVTEQRMRAAVCLQLCPTGGPTVHGMLPGPCAGRLCIAELSLRMR